MQDADRKLAWSGVFVFAVIAAEIAWIIFVGPAHYSADNAAKNASEQNPIWGYVTSAAFWTAFFTFALTVSTALLWWQTKRLAEGADEQSQKMTDSITATNLMAKNLLRAKRPLLVPDNLRLGPFEGRVPKTPDPFTTLVSLFCDFENRGTDTAFLKSATFTVNVGDGPSPMLTADRNEPTSFGYHAIEAGDSWKPLGAMRPLHIPEKTIFNGSEQFFVHGWIRYADIHNISRRCGFCYVLYPIAELDQKLLDVEFRESGPGRYWYDVEEEPES